MDRVYDALRFVMRGGDPEPEATRMDVTAPRVPLGIRAVSMWPDPPGRLARRRVMSFADLPEQSVHSVAGGQRISPTRSAVIGRCLTVWDAGER